jgi:hypothetical protein
MPPLTGGYGRLPERPKGAVCKTVGSAYVGSNPTPATTCENGPWPGVSPAPRAVVRCVILCHRRPGDAAAQRWLRTYSGRDRGRRSGAPNRLLELHGDLLSWAQSPQVAAGADDLAHARPTDPHATARILLTSGYRRGPGRTCAARGRAYALPRGQEAVSPPGPTAWSIATEEPAPIWLGAAQRR